MAVGDCLGGTLQNMGPPEIAARFGVLKEMVGGGWLSLRPGEFGKSTQMALSLGRSLLSKGRFDARAALGHYLEWFDSWPKDVGLATSGSLALLKDGEAPTDAPRKVHELLDGMTAGSNPLARTAPLALAHYADGQRLLADTLADAHITHFDPLAGLAAGALNVMTACALDGQSSRKQVVATARKALDGGNIELDAVLAPPYDDAANGIKPTGYCLDTLRVVLYSFVNTDSFEDALIFAVNLGGNADATGAATGRLCGAHYGVEAIPRAWLGALEYRDEITGMANRLFELASDIGGRE